MKKNLLTRTVAAGMAAMLSIGMLTACGKTSQSSKAETTEAATEAPTEAKGVEYITDGQYPGDWAAPVFENGSTCIPVEDLAKWADTGVTVEVDFTLEDSDYYVLAIAEGAKWDNKLYNVDKSYIEGVQPKDEAYSDDEVPMYYASMQDDGFVSLPAKDCENNGISYTATKFTFTLTSAGIKYLQSNEGTEENPQGIVFQTHGVNVTKVIFDADPIDAKIQ